MAQCGPKRGVSCGVVAMWFDANAALAELRRGRECCTQSPATNATPATSHVRVAIVADVAMPCDPATLFDLLEERAAIREYDGGQSRNDAEVEALAEISNSTGTDMDTLRSIWTEARR